jgi:hypothetical protein
MYESTVVGSDVGAALSEFSAIRAGVGWCVGKFVGAGVGRCVGVVAGDAVGW